MSIVRINTFLDLPELEEDAVISGEADSPTAAEIKGGKFSWDMNSEVNTVTLDK